MKKIVINTCHGGFSLSADALLRFRKETNDDKIWPFEIPRDHPVLVKIVEEMCDHAGQKGLTKLKVVEIPDDIEWSVHEYDGSEWVAEAHRTWS
jgi:hypothetical protein